LSDRRESYGIVLTTNIKQTNDNINNLKKMKYANQLSPSPCGEGVTNEQALNDLKDKMEKKFGGGITYSKGTDRGYHDVDVYYFQTPLGRRWKVLVGPIFETGTTTFRANIA
jgi:hypothetical protein